MKVDNAISKVNNFVKAVADKIPLFGAAIAFISGVVDAKL